MKPELVLIAGEKQGYEPDLSVFLWSDTNVRNIFELYKILREKNIIENDIVKYISLSQDPDELPKQEDGIFDPFRVDDNVGKNILGVVFSPGNIMMATNRTDSIDFECFAGRFGGSYKRLRDIDENSVGPYIGLSVGDVERGLNVLELLKNKKPDYLDLNVLNTYWSDPRAKKILLP